MVEIRVTLTLGVRRVVDAKAPREADKCSEIRSPQGTSTLMTRYRVSSAAPERIVAPRGHLSLLISARLIPSIRKIHRP